MKQKYKYGKRDWQLGMIFNMSSGGATKRRHRIIDAIEKDDLYDAE
ncbi:hypothetical protein [Clostridium fermenticellae]|nr:hypothetical protein [Clostridium fermenticellae]